MMNRADFEAIVAEAMLAPSAHNTQPVRWAQAGQAIHVLADMNRRLPIADPDDRDLKIACGAAVEGTVLALAAKGLGAEILWLESSTDGPLRVVAMVTPQGPARPNDVALAQHVHNRITHRAGFIAAPSEVWSGWDHNHVTLVREPDQINWLADRVDQASATIMRNQAFRKELLQWMRLKETDFGYHCDGLNKEALAMDRLSSLLVPPVLGTKIYDFLSRFGLGPALAGERKRTSEAGAVALFHWPVDGSIFEAGRAFYRYWLEASARGLLGWPAAALADDPVTNTAITERFDLPRDRVLLNAIRLGHAKGKTPNRTRLKTSELII